MCRYLIRHFNGYFWQKSSAFRIFPCRAIIQAFLISQNKMLYLQPWQNGAKIKAKYLLKIKSTVNEEPQASVGKNAFLTSLFFFFETSKMCCGLKGTLFWLLKSVCTILYKENQQGKNMLTRTRFCALHILRTYYFCIYGSSHFRILFYIHDKCLIADSLLFDVVHS